VQNELSAVRVLFELLGFLLRRLLALGYQLSAISDANLAFVHGSHTFQF